MTQYYLTLEKQYLPYVVVDENENIVSFKENTPISAKRAAKEHILLSQKYDDVSNEAYWKNLIEKLGLKNI